MLFNVHRSMASDFMVLYARYAMLVRLHFENGRLIAGHAMVESEAYKAAKKKNKVCYREFTELPKAENFFESIGNLVGLFSGSLETDNPVIGVMRSIPRACT